MNKTRIIYALWLVGVVIWNYAYPTVPPIFDVGMAVILSLFSYGLNIFFNA
ncbi:MAG: hypothetical protein ISR83_01720 [Candidatus Marinimicrobia bacterium]|nr:hypothetical protein [Candidatus Neomarinimicrobiota bacterium]